MTLVEFSNVSKRYANQLAIEQLDLQLQSGAILGLLGPNGAGKTTCLKLIIGLMRPTVGRVSVLGMDVISEGPEVRQFIGYVPEHPQLYPWMTVAETIRFASAMYNSWNHSIADDLCRTFRLPMDKRIKQLSRGLKVKAGLVVALAHRPKLLVLDEPMSGLDPLARDELMEIFVDLKRDETEAIIFSSHQIDDVTRIADEIAILNDGQLLVQQSMDSMLGNTKRIEAVLIDGRLPNPNSLLPQIVWQHVNRRQWSMTVSPFDESMIESLNASNVISSTSVEDLSLEQIFKDWIRGAIESC